jgi:hypothetical protein
LTWRGPSRVFEIAPDDENPAHVGARLIRRAVLQRAQIFERHVIQHRIRQEPFSVLFTPSGPLSAPFKYVLTPQTSRLPYTAFHHSWAMLFLENGMPPVHGSWRR